MSIVATANTDVRFDRPRLNFSAEASPKTNFSCFCCNFFKKPKKVVYVTSQFEVKECPESQLRGLPTAYLNTIQRIQSYINLCADELGLEHDVMYEKVHAQTSIDWKNLSVADLTLENLILLNDEINSMFQSST